MGRRRIEEAIFDEYPGVFMTSLALERNFICIPCRREYDTSYSTGTWEGVRKHISSARHQLSISPDARGKWFSLVERITRENPAIFLVSITDDQKYICRPCQKFNSRYYNGCWISAHPHLQTALHKESMEALQTGVVFQTAEQLLEKDILARYPEIFERTVTTEGQSKFKCKVCSVEGAWKAAEPHLSSKFHKKLSNPSIPPCLPTLSKQSQSVAEPSSIPPNKLSQNLAGHALSQKVSNPPLPSNNLFGGSTWSQKVSNPPLPSNNLFGGHAWSQKVSNPPLVSNKPSLQSPFQSLSAPFFTQSSSSPRSFNRNEDAYNESEDESIPGFLEVEVNLHLPYTSSKSSLKRKSPTLKNAPGFKGVK